MNENNKRIITGLVEDDNILDFDPNYQSCLRLYLLWWCLFLYPCSIVTCQGYHEGLQHTCNAQATSV